MMKWYKIYGAMALSLFLTMPLAAQDHLLITEFAVTPTAGEFIEIYNPTSEAVDLTNYYLTDATFAGGGTFYYNIVTGDGGGGGFGDFNARFPSGATIAAGEYQTVALNGSDNFSATYGVDPTYELYEDGGTADAIPDMLEATTGSISGQGGLSNAGEVIVLYHWDGSSNLVQDIDYVLWGDKAEAIDKTGVTINGDTYQADTPIDDQTIVNADNDDDENPHDDDFSAQRKLDVEDVESWTGGNGITGHDETSENTTWLGGIWTINAPATPGARALGDSLNIADIQFLRADSIGLDANDDSPFLDETLTVTGIVMHGTREINLGARWGAFIQDERGGPWSGFFIIQNDTSVSGTLLSAAQPGDKIRMTGEVQEFPTNPNTQSITQFALFTDPVTPIEFVDFGLPLPDPIVLKPSDIDATGSSEDPRLTERLESTLVRFEGLTVLSNFEGQPGNIMTAGDESGTIAIDDYFFELRNLLDNQTNGQWPGFPTGTQINITGFMRDVLTGGSGRTTINPRSLDDIEVASSPPSITDITRDPVVATSTADVTVSATIIDAQTSVANASVFYRLGSSGDYTEVGMSADGDTWSGMIPAQADGDLVEYFLRAADDEGGVSTVPGDTASSRFFYFVRDDGLKIFDVQFNPFADGNSPYSNLEVTVSGIVTTDTTDFSIYWIQDGTEAWNGVLVNDNINQVSPGDQVMVTGTVGEFFGVTQIDNVTDVTVVSTGNPVPDPVVVPTGDLADGLSAESWEGMLIRTENVEVSTAFPDGGSNFGEFAIDDGSGEVRVDDLAATFDGQNDSSFVEGDVYDHITGIHHFTFGNYKIEPRNPDDIGTKVAVEDRPAQVITYSLDQNYPNPFNPTTTINYSLAKPGQVEIVIFNMLGQKVKTLVEGSKAAGNYVVQWNGRTDAGVRVSSGVYFYKMKSGSFQRINKMIMLK